MMDDLTKQVCEVINETLKTTKSLDSLNSPIDAQSNMDSIPEWDSLSFVNVFMAISEHFDLDVDQDDAIQFISVSGIVELINEIRETA